MKDNMDKKDSSNIYNSPKVKEDEKTVRKNN